MRKLGRAMGLTVIAAIAAIVGCSAIFGLDPPTRAPSEDASTTEAATDATIDAIADHSDASADAPGETTDAPDEAEAEAEAGDGSADAADASDGDGGMLSIRCGFPDAQVLCTGKVQCCVATPNAAGTYACVDNVDAGCAMSSGRYVFECTSPSDCPTGHCCHYNEHAVCGTDCTTSRNETCDLDAGCRGTLTCSPLSINGNLTPYFGCQ
jgi:hypothetical protein